jgi:DNA-binding NtrC family response regulator
MITQILVLSSDRSQGQDWLAALKPCRLNAKVLQAWPDARRLLAEGDARVVLYDADNSIAPVEEVLAEAAMGNLPVIVIARDINASKWVSYFSDGAFDVLRQPAEPYELNESVEAAIKTSRSQVAGKHASWVQMALEWAKSRILHSDRT